MGHSENAPSGAARARRLGDRLEAWHTRLFVGRSFELSFFDALLDRTASRQERIVHAFGSSGIGKSALLDRWRALAEGRGRPVVSVDLRGASRQSGEAETAIRRACEAAGGGAFVLFLDHCDDLGTADQWLRERFLPALDADVLVAMASRRPLQGPWANAAWRSLLVPVGLEALTYGEVREYARRLGLSEQAADELWVRSMGHPLALTLCAASIGGPGIRRQDRPEEWAALVRHWIEEAPEEESVELLSAASIAQRFDQEGLCAILEEDVSDARFDRLTQLSLLRRAADGWGLHDPVRAAFRSSLRARKPAQYERYRDRWLAHTFDRLERHRRQGRSVAPLVGELLQYAASPVLRAHYRQSGFPSSYLETVSERTLPEAVEYIHRRRNEARPVRIRCADPDTGELFRYDLTAPQSLLRLHGIDPASLYALDPRSLRLVRDAEGAVAGLAAAVPLHAGTVPYLAERGVSRAFFAAWPAERLRQLLTPADAPAGWYVLSVDMIDLEREERRSDIVHLMLDYILSGGLTIASPPPLPHYEHIHLAMGFERVPGAEHTEYDGETPTPTYAIDAGGERFMRWLRGLTAPMSAPGRGTAAFGAPDRFGFTPREKEVASRLVDGATNSQIAAQLFVSEAAVKKHIQSMLGKAGVRNRTQLVTRLLEPD